MKNPKISVIIPVYNVSQYLDESLNSILNQSFIDEIEVIMVDDGSTDDSRYIIEKYALDYENFHAYHIENGGAAVARNYALQFVKGEYIHFMDPDDYLNPYAYEKLYNLAIGDDCDIVIANAVKYDRYKIWDENLFKKSFKNFKDDLRINSVNERLSILWDTVLWNKLFKTEFIQSNNIRFPNENIIYQDIPFTLKSYVLASSIFITQEVMYYWRLRKKSTSSTQQYQNIKTFYDRIKILNLSEEIMNELNVSEDIRNFEYHKWLNHDLKLFLKRLTKFSEEYHEDIMFNIQKILKFIPSEYIDDLNSYKKVMYKMVENNDLKSLIRFSSLENELMKNPVVPDDLDDKYHRFIDFNSDFADEELNIEKLTVENDENSILLSFKYNINYVPNTHLHELEFKLIENENEHDLKVSDGNIVIPIDLIKDINERLYIKAYYISKDFIKESYLKSGRRQIIRFDNFDIEFGIGFNRIFSIKVRKTNDNVVEIDEIIFENNEFKFIGKSDSPLENIVLENVLTFDKIEYPISYDNDRFMFKIPYRDICNNPIKKWEIKSDSLFDVLEIPRRMVFYRYSNKILFLNARKKILIEEDIYNKDEELINSDNKLTQLKNENDVLKTKNKALKNKNKELLNVNSQLYNDIKGYKLGKIVHLLNKINKR